MLSSEAAAIEVFDISKDDAVTRSFREVFGEHFRINAPTAACPYHVVTYRERLVVPIDTVRQTLIEDDVTGCWMGDNVRLDPTARIDAISAKVGSALVLDPSVVIPFLWLVEGLPITGNSHPQVLATSDLRDLARAVESLCIVQGAIDSPNPQVASAVANGQSIEALHADRERGGEGFKRLVKAIAHTLKDEKALGNAELTAMNINVTIDDLSDPRFLLPVIAIAAYEDWTMPTRRRTHGTGFNVDIERDPQAALGIRLVNIRPAVPFVALAPIVSATLRCREGDRFVFDDLVRQAGRWAVKNGIEIDVLCDQQGR